MISREASSSATARILLWLLVLTGCLLLGPMSGVIVTAQAQVPASPCPSPANRSNTPNANRALSLFQAAQALGEKPSKEERLQALQKFQEAQDMFCQLDHPLEVSLTLLFIGKLHDQLGESRMALTAYDMGLSWLRTREKKKRSKESYQLEVTLLANSGAALSELGENDQAKAKLEEGLRLIESNKIKEKFFEALMRSHLAGIQTTFGEYREALSNYSKALELLGKGNASENERDFHTSILNNEGSLYQSLGQLDDALNAWQQAARENPAPNLTLLTNLAGVQFMLNMPTEARETLNRAKGASEVESDPRAIARYLSLLGTIHLLKNEHQDALTMSNRALELARTAGDREAQVQLLSNIALLQSEGGELEPALTTFAEAMRQARLLGDPNLESTVASNKGITLYEAGRKSEALSAYLEATAAAERSHAKANLEEFKISAAERANDAYEMAITLLVDAGQERQAFDLSERARARVFLDQIGNTRPVSSNVDERLTRAERNKLQEIEGYETELRKLRGTSADEAGDRAIRQVKDRLSNARAEYGRLLTEIKARDPQYGSLITVDPLKLDDVKLHLDRNTTLVSYFVTAKQTYAFVITSDSLKTFRLEVSEADLQKTVKWFRRFTNLRDPQPQSLKRLYDWLIGPLKDAGALKTPIVGVIPHGILHYLPFAALTDGHNYLGDSYEIFYLPSASVLKFMPHGRSNADGQALVLAQGSVGDLPLLPNADDEATQIAELYHTQALTSATTTKQVFVDRASASRVIHIAAHGILNSKEPLFSRIVLSAGSAGRLELREVYDLKLKEADLVVLSACETELGALSKGDDIVGLSRAFIYAGAPTVVASLWTVDDKGTKDLMTEFHAGLRRGLSKAAALREAQRVMRGNPVFQNPYYWAAFVLTGDPGGHHTTGQLPTR